MRRMLSPRPAAVSLAVAIALAAPVSVLPARHPQYGGTLRVEIAARINSLDPGVASANSREEAARSQISPLLYDHRNADGTFSGAAGSGTFLISAWEPGKRVVLAANNNYATGRPFVDSIEIQMGRSDQERMLDLELGKIDFTQIAPEQARRAAEQGIRVSTSEPDELLAIAFVKGRTVAEDTRAREELARSVDRGTIVSFILQKEGEAAGGLLPQWSSGTAFLFPTDADVVRAKSLWSQIGGSPKIALGYDANDSLEQAIAERIVVNARESRNSGGSKIGNGCPVQGCPRMTRGLSACACGRPIHAIL